MLLLVVHLLLEMTLTIIAVCDQYAGHIPSTKYNNIWIFVSANYFSLLV